MKVSTVPCRIERGAFSGERIFKVRHRHGEVLGGGHPIYFFDRNYRPLGKDVPSREEAIDGYVQCRVLRSQNGEVIVELPGAEILMVDDDQIVNLDASKAEA